MTITEFLEARIAEDEELAAPDPDWDDYKGFCDAAGIHYTKARVLAECAAKRAIMELHPVTMQLWWDEQCEIDVCATCQEDSYPDSWPCPTMKHLAAIYSAHPDYRPEWAPNA